MSDDLIQNFRALSRQYSDASILMHEAIARRAGLSGTDHKYLGLLIQNGQMTAGELSSLTGLTTGAVTGLIDRLEKRKLVKRQFDQDDRRKVIIVPNAEKVMKLLGPLLEEPRIESEKLIASFSVDEIKIIETYFVRAIEIMKETANKHNKN